MSPLAVYGAVPAVITTNVTFRGPRPWTDPRAFGARADAVKVAAAGSTTRSSTTVTLAGFSLTSADVGKYLSLKDLSAWQRVATGALTSGSPTLTATGAGFVANDLGKELQVGYDYIDGGGNNVSELVSTTIAAVVSATSVTMATNAPRTVSGGLVAWQHPTFSGVIQSVPSATTAVVAVAPTTTMSGAEVTLGTDDTAAIQAAVNAASGDVVFLGGRGVNYLLTGKVFARSGIRFRGDGAAILRSLGHNTGYLIEVPAGSIDVRFQQLVVDNNHVLTTPAIYMRNAVTKVAVDDCEFRDIGSGRLLAWEEGATQHTYASITRCRMTRRLPRQGARGGSENLNSVWVVDCSYVTITDNVFRGTSSVEVAAVTPAACTASNPMRHVVVANNTFEDVFCTTLWIASVTSTYLTNVLYSGNTFERCGLWIEKGSIYGLIQGTVENLSVVDNRIRGGGYLASSAGYADSNTPGLCAFLAYASTDAKNVTIARNQIDNRFDDGTIAPGLAIGIYWLGPVSGLTIADNQLQYIGGEGITLRGISGAPITNAVVARNTVMHCVNYGDAATEGSGITASEYMTTPMLLDNVSVRNGTTRIALTQTAGLQVGGFTGGAAGASRADTVTDAILRNNRTDSEGVGAQKYGILLGTTTGAYHPTDVVLDGNVARGNATASIWFSTTVSRNHLIGQNPGYNSGIGQPVYIGNLVYTGTNTATFTLPIPTAPMMGMLIAEQTYGDDHGIKTYHVMYHASSSAYLTLSAVISTMLSGSGSAPTIAVTTPSTGTLTVTNTYNAGASNVAIKVFYIPMTWGAA